MSKLESDQEVAAVAVGGNICGGWRAPTFLPAPGRKEHSSNVRQCSAPIWGTIRPHFSTEGTTRKVGKMGSSFVFRAVISRPA